MRNNDFATWLGQTLLGFALFFCGIEIARISWNGTWELVAAGILLAVTGFAVMALAEKRARPKRVLRKARKSLSFPTQWAVKFDKKLPQGGSIPVAVIRSDGVRFLIDIQGLSTADWSGPTTKGVGVLSGPGGKGFRKDPVAHLLEAAVAWNATPVLWLHQAQPVRNLRRPDCPLIVVMGGSRELSFVLRGAEIVPNREASLEMTMPPKFAAKKNSKAGVVASPEPA